MGGTKATATAAAIGLTFAITGCSSITTANDIATPVIAESDIVTTNIEKGRQLGAGQRIEVRSRANWTIESVTLSGPGNQPPPSPRMWRSAPLAPAQSLELSATLRGPDAVTRSIRRTLSTGPASQTFHASITPEPGTYGVGVIPKIEFDMEIPKKDRKTLLSKVTVKTTPSVDGRWHWLSDDTAAYRPAGFWPARTRAAIAGDFDTTSITGDDGTLYWGKHDEKTSFRTGRSLIVTINSESYSGTVMIDGKVVRKLDVSLGKAGFRTRSGIKTLTDKYRWRRMTNIGITTEEVYDLQVPYAMRITDSGEFLHGAPWNGNIGYAHTSHGCTNLRLSDAEFIFDRMMTYDPVLTTGTGRSMGTDNGPGAAWNIPFRQWNS